MPLVTNTESNPDRLYYLRNDDDILNPHLQLVEMWWLIGDVVAHRRCGGSLGDVVAHWRCGGSLGDVVAHW